MRRIRIAVAMALLMTGLPAVSPPGGWSAALQPMVVGWEGIFKLDWEVKERRGKQVVSGYLRNDSPYAVTSVQLLVDALDPAGAVIAQKVGWANAGALEPFSRAYFELPTPGPGASYRVRVFAFDRVESGGDRR